MADWSAAQYLKFADERTRPSRDLLAAVPLAEARHVVDIGCGPGNSTELLAERFAGADVKGVDSSPAMLEAARRRLPGRVFEQADARAWSPAAGTDLLFANAVFQWLPDHPAILVRLLGELKPGAVLAVQMPDNLAEPSHRAMREIAASGPWRDRLQAAIGHREPLPSPAAYYDLLAPLSARVEVWHTLYNHALADPAAIVEWVKGTGLRPFVDPLDEADRKAYLDAYLARIAADYPPRVDGKVLLRFPRIFIVAIRA
jgi:trans-aconitate 2-methyltransferase